MNKLSLPPFYVGQKVVCVHPTVGLIKDKTYTVTRLEKCFCGTIFVSVGILDTDVGKKFISQCCNKEFVCGSEEQFLCYRFAPLQKENFPLMTFSKIVEKEKEEILINN